MTYQRIQIPRFYVDTPNWLVSRGIATSEFACKTGSDLIDHDGTFVDEELFDMNPSNQVVFSTSDSSATRADHVMFVIDKQATDIPTNFIAILNHNMASADAKFLGATSSSDITSVNPTAETSTTVLNGTESSDIFTPVTNGDSIITFDTADSNRYIAVHFEGASSNTFSSSNDLKIGCILVGEYFDMPLAPDLQVTRSVSFGNDIMETPAGQRFSQARWLEGNQSSTTQSGQPFRNATSPTSQRLGGRTAYNMNFSFLDDDDLTTSNIATDSATDSFYNMVWNRTGGSHIPFIFTPDSTSTTAGDYIFSRFAQNEWSSQQVASRVFSTSLNIIEEF